MELHWRSTRLPVGRRTRKLVRVDNGEGPYIVQPLTYVSMNHLCTISIYNINQHVYKREEQDHFKTSIYYIFP